jgi:hypothetical protein
MAKKMKINGSHTYCTNCSGHVDQDSPKYTKGNNYEGRQRALNRPEVRSIYGDVNNKLEAFDRDELSRVRDINSSFFAGLDPRRRQEAADAGMVQEDHRAVANLSPRFINREYPREGFYFTPYLDDIIKDTNG